MRQRLVDAGERGWRAAFTAVLKAGRRSWPSALAAVAATAGVYELNITHHRL
jgi:hypothetical protein